MSPSEEKQSATTGKDVEAEPVYGVEETSFDPAVVKRFKLKADFILLPILTVAYLFKYTYI